jgi:hypothetical protein
MKKSPTIYISSDDIASQIEILEASSLSTLNKISDAIQKSSPLEALGELKFGQIGCDPLDPHRSLNLIEQLNQSFTYLASFKAAEYLFNSDEHKKQLEKKKIKLNLGTASGSDIEALDGKLVAEVFATTNITNNSKLKNDIEKVLSVDNADYRYVFFLTNNNQSEAVIHNTKIKYDGVTIICLDSKLKPTA